MSHKNGEKRTKSVVDWRRPAGPLNVWRIIESDVGNTEPLRVSIQEVPEDRYDEVVQHLRDYFIVDEATCSCLNLKDDKDAQEDFSEVWYYLLREGMSIAAFKLGSDDKLMELVAINALYVCCDRIEEALGNFTVNFKSPNARKIFEFMHNLSLNADVRNIYDVDKYISALGLSVAPAYRGRKLGVRLLEARDDIGRKYGITATSTMFTGFASQLQAERAGFETAFTKEYNKVIDKEGNLIFPGIQSKSIKIMIKRLK